MKQTILPSVFLLFALIGCSSETTVDTTVDKEPAFEKVETKTIPKTQSKSAKAVSFDDLGDAWPLTVQQGILKCRAGSLALFVAPDGKEYALNGTANSKGYPRINPIWADNAKIPGTKKNIGVLIILALELC